MNSHAPKRLLLVAVGLLAVLVLPAPAGAATPSPGWTVHSFATATNFSATQNDECLATVEAGEPQCDAYRVTAINAGAQPTDGGTVTLSDTPPAGLTVQRVRFFWSGLPEEFGGENQDLAEFGLCTAAPVGCQLPTEEFGLPPIAPDDRLEMRVYVTVEPSAPASLTNSASVSGGGAPEASTTTQNPVNEAALPPFGFSAFDSRALDSDGTPDTQAGSHPYELTTRIDLNNGFLQSPQGGHEDTSIDDPKDIIVDLPVGFSGSALSAPTCRLAQLASVGKCPPETQVGHLITGPEPTLQGINSPIWNVVPEHGVAAEFGVVDFLKSTHVLYANVVPTAAGYVLRTTGRDIPQVTLADLTVNFYGDPATRDGSSEPPVPFFTNPAQCNGEPLVTAIHMDAWQAPGSYNADGSPNFGDPAWASATSVERDSLGNPVTISGCDQLAGLFNPKITATPETNRADSPTGLEVDLKVPQTQGVENLATPPLKKAVVALPEGMTVNPSSANGLEGCSLSALGMSASGQPDAAPPHCPDASKIGTVELETPALPGTLEGKIYVAKQTENPFHSLLALYIVVDDPTTGVIVKIPAEIKADPTTGQLTTVVDNAPQFPFSELRTHFFGGQKAALRTPSVCGKYTVTSTLTPWSAPQSGPPATPSASFNISQGCSASAAAEPNKPAFSAGTLTPLAGAYSPFVLKLSREDGSQELAGLSVALPPGLLGKLAGLTECSEPQLAAARSREVLGQGALEQGSPSCPASSEVGTVTVGAGAGLTPYYATGHAYLAGPYKGAPLSLAVITPAVAGPFDLGSVLIRNALQVDPFTAQITAVSDPIPHILDGIPLDIRSIALKMDRPNFTLNPTNCERFAVSGSATSVLGQSAPLTNPFQVGGCKNLGFKPSLKLSLKGATRRHTFPALKAVLTYPKKGAYANVAKAQVTLPHSAFLEQGHIKTVCTQPQLASRSCPANSIYGHATAYSPLLDKPLSGPVYLGVGFGHKLPDLVAELNGQIRVLLHGKVDTGREDGLRNTFQVVPDAPVSKFVLELDGGKKSLIVNSENLCGPHAKVKAVADFTAQNGKVLNTEPIVQNSCKGGKGKKHNKGGKGKRGAASSTVASFGLGALRGGW